MFEELTTSWEIEAGSGRPTVYPTLRFKMTNTSRQDIKYVEITTSFSANKERKGNPTSEFVRGLRPTFSQRVTMQGSVGLTEMGVFSMMDGSSPPYEYELQFRIDGGRWLAEAIGQVRLPRLDARGRVS